MISEYSEYNLRDYIKNKKNNNEEITKEMV